MLRALQGAAGNDKAITEEVIKRKVINRFSASTHDEFVDAVKALKSIYYDQIILEKL